MNGQENGTVSAVFKHQAFQRNATGSEPLPLMARAWMS
jgi:hypothetical protein